MSPPAAAVVSVDDGHATPASDVNESAVAAYAAVSSAESLRASITMNAVSGQVPKKRGAKKAKKHATSAPKRSVALANAALAKYPKKA